MDKAVSLLKERDNFVILPHINPDGDTLGSCFALCEGLRTMGKTAYIFPEEAISSRYDMIVKAEYLCDASFYPQTVIAVDCGDQSMLGKRGELYDGRVDLCVDHHLSHNAFAAHTVVDPKSSAAGELVFFILEKLGIPLSKAMAKSLYVSIVSDTGCFKFSNVTATTHMIGAKLLEVYGNFYAVNYELFDSRTMDQMRAESEVLGTLEFFRGNQIAAIVITDEMREKTNTSEEDTDYFSQLPRRIRGVEVGITYKENGQGSWRVSLRTNGVVNASSVCGTLGGGGHIRAAGARLEGSLSQVKEKVLAAVYDALDHIAK